MGEIRSKRKLRLMHSDVCGHMPTESMCSLGVVQSIFSGASLKFQTNTKSVTPEFPMTAITVVNTCPRNSGAT